jgi:hypothetical protein
MDIPIQPVPVVTTEQGLGQIVAAIRELTKELQQVRGELHVIAAQVLRGNQIPR